jgi:hypothetical protein
LLYALHSQHQIKGRHLEKDIFYLLRVKCVTSGISHVTTPYDYQLRHCILVMFYKFPNGIFIVWCFIKHILVNVFCFLVRCNTCIVYNDCHVIWYYNRYLYSIRLILLIWCWLCSAYDIQLYGLRNNQPDQACIKGVGACDHTLW